MDSNIENQIDESMYESMLNFERQIFIDAVETDGLFISAKGLHMDTVIKNLLKVYCDPGNLIIVLNSSESEENFYIKELNSPHVYSNTYQTAQNVREDVYLNGGIHFITTRILVVDLLKQRVPIDKITGMIVLRAHTIIESCQEAFALRLYRQHNKTGFIKAFSNCAQSFTINFGQVERVMRTVFVKNLYLWPRFHSIVIEDLKKYEPVVVELHIPISNTLKDAQSLILDLMNQTVKELKRINKTLDLQEITVENCITKKFHKILQAQLDAVWYQLSSKTKQLVADLKTLRHLIVTMIHNDPVTFYSVISRYMTIEHAMKTSWVGLDAAEQLFETSKQLIYTGNAINQELNPQLCTKWEALNEILKKDIPMDLKELKSKHEDITRNQVKVLILCSDSKTCYQLQQVLTYGPEKYLFLNVIKHRIPFRKLATNFTKQLTIIEESNSLGEKSLIEQKMNEILTMYDSKTEAIASKKKRKTKNNDEIESEVTFSSNDITTILEDVEEDQFDEETKNSYFLKMSQTQCIDSTLLEKSSSNATTHDTEADEISNESRFHFEAFPEMENLDMTQMENENPLILIQTFKNKENSLNLKQTLAQLKPNYIIMYHSDMAAIRQIEVYEAKNKRSRPLKVYFLIHSGTVEEQSYLTTLRREKQAFEFLIETKAKMVVPDYQDGKSDDCLMLQREGIRIMEKNTRKAGGQENEQDEIIIPKIIVDIREFRSELPALIHKRGIEIEPMTISVGDYVLTPEICIERKSISDLIQSLNSGRLYHQCVQMSRFYTKPMLLIEFDQNKPFHLQSNYVVSSDVSHNDIQVKLQLLTLHFPKLKLIWSPSPYATAQLFEELKEGKDQPNLEYALSISGEDDVDIIEKKYNAVVYDFVQKLPGIHSKNIDTFLRRGKNLDHIITLTEEELSVMLDNPNDAKLLYNIIHEVHKPEEEGVTGTKSDPNKPGSSKWKLKNKFRHKKT